MTVDTPQTSLGPARMVLGGSAVREMSQKMGCWRRPQAEPFRGHLRCKERSTENPSLCISALCLLGIGLGQGTQPYFSSSSLKQSFPLSTLKMKWNDDLVKFSKIVKKKFRWQVAQDPLQHQGVSGFGTVHRPGVSAPRGSLVLLTPPPCSTPSSSHRTCLQDATEKDNSTSVSLWQILTLNFRKVMI